VATLHYSARALEDLARLGDFLIEDDSEAGRATAALILDGLEVLETHPLIGRIATGTLRELVISRGRSGYLALYEYQPATDRVVVVAIRHQREAGFEE
jgi:plasmid stabilization system protein ParE